MQKASQRGKDFDPKTWMNGSPHETYHSPEQAFFAAPCPQYRIEVRKAEPFPARHKGLEPNAQGSEKNMPMMAIIARLPLAVVVVVVVVSSSAREGLHTRARSMQPSTCTRTNDCMEQSTK